ncbi:hypothetical protein DACRYDRAFT_23815 [Dacryopinax primogenitus]|uniref:Oxidoreductase-like domain-containing protein n=1 Tax=Dacryopinax primogenitus (strain DJM 731) TaxID=1858805 RepID=M5FUP9_DACPD|nr:uncharacterized protein DACRYDRAFT_23815 [Dacryopinax primogenitus]EJT99204.1 hypothetical protein DACRYDRAFT_23815 [Dacryopinax primogenitus]
MIQLPSVRYLCTIHDARISTVRRSIALAARLQSTSTTSALPILMPPKPPGAVRRRRGGINLGAYPQLLSNNHPNTYISLASQPVFTSFQETPKPGEVPFMKEVIPAEMTSAPLSTRVDGKSKRVLKGIELPEMPMPPASDECCMSGCATCVYDLYTEVLEAYHADLLVARQKLTAAAVPESLWPEDVLSSGTDGKSAGKKAKEAVDDEISRLDVSLKAFLAMERALKTKRVGDEVCLTVGNAG